jgi:hypothetical protein
MGCKSMSAMNGSVVDKCVSRHKKSWVCLDDLNLCICPLLSSRRPMRVLSPTSDIGFVGAPRKGSACDPDEDFVHVPLVPWSRPAASQAVGETRGEFLAPASDRFVGDDNAAPSQDQAHISQTKAEHVVEPDSVAEDLGGGNRWR